jgi:hypothetical protein
LRIDSATIEVSARRSFGNSFRDERSLLSEVFVFVRCGRVLVDLFLSAMGVVYKRRWIDEVFFIAKLAGVNLENCAKCNATKALAKVSRCFRLSLVVICLLQCFSRVIVNRANWRRT